MKSYLKFIMLAIIIGITLAFFFYKDIEKEVRAFNSNIDQVKVFQVGVFKNKDKALEEIKKYEQAYLYQDQDYYRIYVGVTINEEEKLKEYFTSLEYDYYLKTIRINKNIYEKIKRYDEVLNKSTKKTTIKFLLKEMNELFLKSQT